MPTNVKFAMGTQIFSGDIE